MSDFDLAVDVAELDDAAAQGHENDNDNDEEEEEEGDDYDDDDRYCYCRLKWDGVAPMLECDGCGEWFHFVCAAVDAAHVPAEFFCIACEDVHGDGKRLRRIERAAFAKQKSAMCLSSYVDQVRPLVAREPAFTSDGRLARVLGRPVPTVAPLPSEPPPSLMSATNATAAASSELALAAASKMTDRRALLLALHRLDSHTLTRALLFLKQHAADAVRVVDLERIELDLSQLDELTARKLALHVGLS